MASNIKGITVEINGDSSNFSKAIKSLNSDIKSTQKELNGVNTLLKLDPSNVELLTQKEQLLTQAISETETKLDALKQAQEQMKEAGLDESSDEYRNLQREIVLTEQKLNSLKEQQKDFGSVAVQQIKAAGEKVSEYGDKISDLGSKFAGLSATAAGALTAVGGLAYKAGTTADDINTLAKTTGVATDEIQKINYASDLLDVSFDTISGSMKKLKNNMQSAQEGSSKMQNAFDSLDISVTNADGSLRSSNDVFYETIDALGKISNETERDALAMDIFGKSATDLNPLIMSGSKALKELGAEAENAGLIMSQDTLDAANAFNDAIDHLKAQASGTFLALGAEIAEALTPALEAVCGAIETALGWIRGLDEGTLAIIGTILMVVASIAPVLTVLGVIVGHVGKLIALLPAIISGVSSVMSVVKTLFAILSANPIGAVIALIALAVEALLVLYNTNETFRKKVDEVFNAVKATVTAVLNTLIGFFTKTVPDAIGAMIKKAQEIPTKMISAIKSAVDGIKSLVNSFKNIGGQLISGLWNGINDKISWLKEKIAGLGRTVLNSVKDIFGIASPSKEMAWMGDMMAQGLGKGFADSMKNTTKAMTGTLNSSKSTLANSSVAGQNAVVQQSAPQNITLNAKLVTSNGRELANYVLKDLINVAKANGTPIVNPT